jgi:hypothetical protein
LSVSSPAVSACCSFQSTSSNTLIPTSVTQCHSANFNTVTVLSLGSGYCAFQGRFVSEFQQDGHA